MKRHADPTLTDVEELYASLHDGASPAEAERWWTLVLKVQSSLECDQRCPKGEHEAMHRIRDRVSSVYAARNKGHTPDYTSARVAVIGLQNSLEARTTGLDGHKLR